MKKNKIFFIVATLILLSCSVAVKKIAGLKNPRVETKETTFEFLTKLEYPMFNNYILKGSNDSTLIIKSIMKCLSHDVLLFNSLGVRYCYKTNEKCNGVKLRNAFSDILQYYEPCVNDTLNLHAILSTLESLDLDFYYTYIDSSDYFLIIYWSKFYGGKKRLVEDLELITLLKNTSKYNISIMLVNTDLQADWGLESGKRLKLKFKFLGKKSASIEFGKIPYSRQNDKCP